ncbi:MAG: hypothetical protein ACXQTR_01555 [Candidatus Methanospirareceae archaeon]
MSEESTKSDVWRRVNWPGIIAGLLIIVLPFLGRWWRFTLGTDALVMAISPFGIDVSIFGEPAIISPLVWWLVVAFVAALLIIIVLVNQLPGMLGVPLDLQLPYLMGSRPFSPGFLPEGMELTIPIFMGFTRAFAIAVVAAALGAVAWLYQKRLE